jgi:hypothetical protein
LAKSGLLIRNPPGHYPAAFLFYSGSYAGIKVSGQLEIVLRAAGIGMAHICGKIRQQGVDIATRTCPLAKLVARIREADIMNSRPFALSTM